VQESNHHIGNLRSRVVDVILDVHFPARQAQQPDKRVAQNGVTQMPDMRRLVGIDAGMLDQHFARGNLRHRSPVRRQLRRHFGAVHANVNVAAARHFEFFKAGIEPTPATTSSAILRGALRNLRASSKARGSAYSPNSIFGGCSTTIVVICRS